MHVTALSARWEKEKLLKPRSARDKGHGVIDVTLIIAYG